MEQLDKNREMIKRVEYCQEHGNECNDWEDEFLESVHNQLMKGFELSTKEGGQLETLEKIESVVEWGREAYWEEFGRG
jgi:hypothetical protein